jgi:hypothetical protein
MVGGSRGKTGCVVLIFLFIGSVDDIVDQYYCLSNDLISIDKVLWA